MFGLLSYNATDCDRLSSVKFSLFGHSLRFVYPLKHADYCTLEITTSRNFRNSAFFPLFIIILKIRGDYRSVKN